MAPSSAYHLNLIPVYVGNNFPALDLVSKVKGLEIRTVENPSDLEEADQGILMLDASLKRTGGAAPSWRGRNHWPFLIIGEEGIEHVDFLTPRGWPEIFTIKALEGAVREFNLLKSRRRLRDELSVEHAKLLQLTNIGQALSGERDLNQLLTLILEEGRHWACCDAAALFLVDRKDEKKPKLVFKLTQNDSMPCPFQEQRFPLNKNSIAGFVAVTGEELNIPDVYRLPTRKPFHFNNTFDESMGYRTRSMLTIPMKNHNREVIGVLQFINRKSSPEIKLVSKEITEQHTMPFDKEAVLLLKALASQAAVAIGNTILVNQIQELFEGFVKASVHAIEQRDPTTSGHSFRVADFTTTLVEALPQSGNKRFAHLSFNKTQIKQIRYAALLHDFGKVGVREPVLVKAKKLPNRRMNEIWHRFTLLKERLRARSERLKVDYLLEHGKEGFRDWAASQDRLLLEEIDRYDRFFNEVKEANEPTILAEGRFNHLEQVRDIPSFEVDGQEVDLLSNEEFLALSVRKGSLTPEERMEIESHVVHTYNFLKRIPWTIELQQVPAFALAHHEKINGTGYPNGWKGDQIPIESRAMTISDIYDALTASDRPYKKALPQTKALDILKAEANNELIDRDMVDIFIEAKLYERTGKTYQGDSEYLGFSKEPFNRAVCDYEHDHSDS